MRREKPLVPQVMDGEDDGSVAEEFVVLVKIAQIDGNQRRLPVVAVDDIRRGRRPLYQFQRRETERRKTLCIVRIILTLLLVQSRAVEEKGALDQKGPDLACDTSRSEWRQTCNRNPAGWSDFASSPSGLPGFVIL